jgi:hypothetical protein
VHEDRQLSIAYDNHIEVATFEAQQGSKPNLWGDVPAIDVLNLSKIGGVEKAPPDLKLLFAASGDLRNVVQSLLGLPETNDGTCTVVMNDRDSTVVVRIILLLLVAYIFPEDETVPTMIHLWYSAFLPKCMVDALQEKFLPTYQTDLQQTQEQSHRSSSCEYVTKSEIKAMCVSCSAKKTGCVWKKL